MNLFNIASVRLVDFNNNNVWVLNTTNKSEDFIEGLIYGATYLYELLPEYTVYVHQYEYDQRVDILEDMFDFISASILLKEVPKYTYDAQPNYYTVWLRKPINTHPDVQNVDRTAVANLVNVKSIDFFQGLFTALKSDDIPYERVVLHKPIKNGVAYDIQGLNLPDLKDIPQY